VESSDAKVLSEVKNDKLNKEERPKGNSPKSESKLSYQAGFVTQAKSTT